ncbi:MAG: hypothetical protein CFE32_24765 [Alphaproteobacteria bacterium PA3]|nr:MAG: hypothetical protein CFE32_24765 [Alphaproteobacteria bacterium PA3]
MCDITRTWASEKLLAALENANVPAGRINTVEQAFADPQIVHRSMKIAMKRGNDGAEIFGIRSPIKFSAATLDCDRPAPLLGDGDQFA